MIQRRRKQAGEGLGKLLSETQELVTALLKENRALKAQNKRLSGELERISKGWDEVRRLARSAPRRRR